MNILEQRNAQRINLEAPIDVTLSNGDKMCCQSYDFSDTGLYVFMNPEDRKKFPIGAMAQVQFQGLNYIPPVVATEVVREDSKGVGFKILDTITPGSEISHDVSH